jgi:hypothetical protein
MLQKFNSFTRALAAAVLLLLSAAAPLLAQSGDANYPTPVFTSEVAGRISPRDLGDPRRTRHFYTFRGTEGDLVVNLETSNLIGDVDVFTATTFQPLVKFTLFGDAARLTKSFYLRGEQLLVLRVEARAVGDAEGTYRVSFGGSFAPAPPELANAETPAAPTLSGSDNRGEGTRRVTSTGARIEEPRTEPTPEETEAAAPRPSSTRSTARRGSAASRRGRGTRTAPARPRTETATAKPETAETSKPEESTAEPRPTPETPAADTPRETTTPRATATPRRRSTRTTRRGAGRTGEAAGRTSGASRAESSAAPPPAAPAQRLIIVTKDGETLEQAMSAVRRVTVENNQLVVLLRDGKVIRRPMLDVLRMSIEP